MKFFLAFVLIDLDEPLYKAAAVEMIRSARRAYKDHEMTIVQLTDNRSMHCPDADAHFTLDTDVKGANFCQMKGFLMAEFALKADRPVIFCDVDLLFNNDGLIQSLRHSQGVSCMWRDDNAAMPINTGVVTSCGYPHFWEQYKRACEDLPQEVQAWYGDQVAMTAAWLDEWSRGGSEPPLRTLDMNETAPALDALPDAPLTTPAVHFKGDRKRMIPAYARMLDGGGAFEFARPSQIIEAVADQRRADLIQHGRGTDIHDARTAAAIAVARVQEQSSQGWSF